MAFTRARARDLGILRLSSLFFAMLVGMGGHTALPILLNRRAEHA
jgi:hypothetical protein